MCTKLDARTTNDLVFTSTIYTIEIDRHEKKENNVDLLKRLTA